MQSRQIRKLAPAGAQATDAQTGPVPVTQSALLLPVGTHTYALPVDSVREVVESPAVTRLPTAPDVFSGIFNLRGEIVPLLDTARWFGEGEIPNPPFAVVVETVLGNVALSATGMPLTADLGDAVDQSELAGTSAIYKVGRQSVVMIDIDSAFAPKATREGPPQ
jgi:purine-binding chemotaxis protein CheW